MFVPEEIDFVGDAMYPVALKIEGDESDEVNPNG